MTGGFPFGGEVSSFANPFSNAHGTGVVVNDSEDHYSAESFASAAVSLYLDETKWTDSQRKGGDIMNNLYSHDLNSRSLVSRMLYTRDNLQQIRASNCIGSILNYQLNRGTKYFSQWIEEKNKNKKQ
jgi:hypothetical protein